MLEENIKDFINMRVENLSNRSGISEEYIKERDKTIELFNKIIKILPTESEKLMFDYEDYITNLLTYEIENSYKEGFCDSFNLFLKMYNNKN